MQIFLKVGGLGEQKYIAKTRSEFTLVSYEASIDASERNAALLWLLDSGINFTEVILW